MVENQEVTQGGAKRFEADLAKVRGLNHAAQHGHSVYALDVWPSDVWFRVVRVRIRRGTFQALSMDGKWYEIRSAEIR